MLYKSEWGRPRWPAGHAIDRPFDSKVHVLNVAVRKLSHGVEPCVTTYVVCQVI